jgi:hypothetical protein
LAKMNLDRAKLSDEAIKFVGTFLRFEFALKESRFGLEDGEARVEWGRVTKELGEGFYRRIQESRKAETIMRRPPKKQVLRHNELDWEPQKPPGNIHELFVSIRRVRNNLLHGGKSGGPENDPKDLNRNEKLIREAQWIIEQALHQMGEVRNHFEGP